MIIGTSLVAIRNPNLEVPLSSFPDGFLTPGKNKNGKGQTQSNKDRLYPNLHHSHPAPPMIEN